VARVSGEEDPCSIAFVSCSRCSCSGRAARTSRRPNPPSPATWRRITLPGTGGEQPGRSRQWVCNAAQCTLREAINDPASTEITFAAGLTGPITLARPGAGGGTLVIEKPLTITGPSSRVIIQRRSTDPAFRMGMLALRNSRVAQNSGGGLFSHQGTLTLRNSLVTSNSGRGVVSRGGTLELTRSTVSENSDAGIAIALGHATLTEARIVANNGGGIGAGQATVMLTNSTVARNSAVDGAGIFLGGASSMAIVNSTVVGNSATGLGWHPHICPLTRAHHRGAHEQHGRVELGHRAGRRHRQPASA
jgi:hypothetical protein